MTGTEVILTDMLECREERAARQRQFLMETGCPLLSFSMNIPGPVKTNAALLRAFLSGREALRTALHEQGLPIRREAERHEKTGDELLYAVDAEPSALKALSVRIEERHPLGRLFDIDVIDRSGEKLSRPAQRRCLLCGGPAQDCAHSRRHSVAEMQERIEALLRDFLRD